MKIKILFGNSENPGQMSHSASSALSLNKLPLFHKQFDRQIALDAYECISQSILISYVQLYDFVIVLN